MRFAQHSASFEKTKQAAMGDRGGRNQRREKKTYETKRIKKANGSGTPSEAVTNTIMKNTKIDVFVPPKVQMKLSARLGTIPRQATPGVAAKIRELWLVRNNCPENEIESLDAQMEKIMVASARAERAALRAKKQAARDKRVARELGKIAAEVNRRWTLDAADVTAFAEHANEPGEGRVLRTKSACAETFETRVYMALVAWVRHNYTGYDDALTASKNSAYRDYVEAKENDANWETKALLLFAAAAEHRQNHANLHKQFTNEAVAWLTVREVKTEITA